MPFCLVRDQKTKQKNPYKSHDTNGPFYCATLCLAEHMQAVSLRLLLSELLFRKSPTINFGLYHTAAYGRNVPKGQLLAKTQKVCFFSPAQTLF